MAGKNNQKKALAGGNSKATFLAFGAILLGLGILKGASLLLPARGTGLPYLSTAKDILALLGLLVSGFVLQGYLKSYLEVKSGFSLSLSVFVLSIALFMATSSRTLMGILGIEVGYGILSIVPLVFSVGAVGLLAYASLE